MGAQTFKIGAATFAVGADDDLSADLLLATCPEALEAGSQALSATWKRPVRLTPTQARALRWWHRQGAVSAGTGATFKTRWRRGRKVAAWRIPGQAGADLAGPPSSLAVDRAVLSHRAALAKTYRAARLAFLNASRAGQRTTKGQATEAQVLALLAEGKPVHQVARLAGLTEQHIRRIRRKNTNILEKG